MTHGILSSLFDSEYYLSVNTDVASAGVDPLDHYLEFGWRERRNPAEFFLEDAYRIRYNLDTSDGAALVHFAEYIEDLQLSPHPLIDRSHLLHQFDLDLRVPSKRWLLGLSTDISLHPIFDLPWMIHAYGDLGGRSHNPCAHFIIWGESEFRNPRANVDVPKIRNQLEALGASAEQLARPLTTWAVFGSLLAIRINDVCDIEWAVMQQILNTSESELTVQELSMSCPMIDWKAFLEMSRPHTSIHDQFALAAVGPLEYITEVNPALSKSVAMGLIENYYA